VEERWEVDMRKLKELELGDGSFEGGERLFLSGG
jgi:hypothetical protein